MGEGSGVEEAVVMRTRRVQGLDVLFVGNRANVMIEVGKRVVEEVVGGDSVFGSGVEEGERSGKAGRLLAALGFAAEPKRELAD